MSGHAQDQPAGDRQPFFSVFRFSLRAIQLVWVTSPALMIILGVLTVVAGLLPAAVAYVGQLIIDGVVAAIETARAGHPASYEPVIRLVLLEGLIVAALAGAQRGISACQSLLRALLGQRVNEMILDKALTLSLSHFEDSEFYDKLTRARREASSRPLGLINKTFGLLQNAISIVTFAALLLQFSPWAVLLLALAGLPSFFAEAKFSGDAFRLFRWRSPDTRMQIYLETVMAREDHAKEVKLFGLGPRLMQRYRSIFRKLFSEDRSLTIRREAWGFVLGLVGTIALYGAYVWVVVAAIDGAITLGQMTMYMMLFRQGQSAVSSVLSAISGMYEDNLYLSNLYEYLEQPVPPDDGSAILGPDRDDGVRFENVSFTYPGAERPALDNVTLHIRRGETLALVGENGSGKTTLIKLLTRLYQPDSGRVLLDGLDLREWDATVLHRRIGVIFQDFNRYQMLVGENIGAGDVAHFEDRERWTEAAAMGKAGDFIADLPRAFDTQLGRWFKDGRELSGGQWQKIALSRAFMRRQADILVLDEPTAAMDAGAEAEVFEHFSTLMQDRIAVLISHRFSTVRKADHIIVMESGRVVEEGSHESLMALEGRYATLFSLQAKGYR